MSLPLPDGVVSISTVPASGTLTSGGTVVFTVSLADPAFVSGTPTLTLSNTGTATYMAGASTPTSLVFDYVVGGPTQATGDLTVSGLDPNGGSVLSSTSFARRRPSPPWRSGWCRPRRGG
jgi:hypothetical protein